MDTGLRAIRDEIIDHHRLSEASLLSGLIATAHVDAEAWRAIASRAQKLIDVMRSSHDGDWIALLLHQYPLNSQAGQALMGLAECSLRVPDRQTAQWLLRDKLVHADWTGNSSHPRFPMKCLALGLQLSKTLLHDESTPWRRWVGQAAGPAIALGSAWIMRLLGGQFIFGDSIETALQRARRSALTCSFDMLGEAACTAVDAERYCDAYRQAITAVAIDRAAANSGQHSVSIKLSALHPRYESLQAAHAVPELVSRLSMLAELAMANEVGLTIDAEECDRLEMSLDIIEQLLRQPGLQAWDGLSIAVQAYQKRALPVIDWIDSLARTQRQRIGIRLVKGAYWDMEIKRCQERGLSDFPVFTRKAATDVSYLACARRMLSSDYIAPAFATHNALTAATLLSWIGARRDVEFQRLHGMGAALYECIAEEQGLNCRIYAPVGEHRELLPYLIRRMLENGANSNFVQQLGDTGIESSTLLRDPVSALEVTDNESHPAIVLPVHLYGAARRNSEGLDLSDRRTLNALNARLESPPPTCHAHPMGSYMENPERNRPASLPVRNPADPQHIVGNVTPATHAEVAAAINATQTTTSSWSAMPVEQRCACLENMANLLEQQQDGLLSLLIREAGKTRSDAVNEIREAVDFCRYYASEARKLLNEQTLPGPSGELNVLNLHARGVFACISPWNFPLAIFLGQIAAALVTGNGVIAKPAPQTPLIAALAVQLLYQAGIPASVLHLLPGGTEVGDWIVRDVRITGIAFTGSTATARRIARTVLEDEQRPLTTVIAETGGINAMIVDSTALTEQVVADVLTSAFQSAGQRCSALRLLCLQEEIYDSTVALLTGAMAELRVGDPIHESTDVGPLSDEMAHQRILQYLHSQSARILYRTPMPSALPGWFVAPTLIALNRPQDLQQEIFGPVLHVTRWQAGKLDELIDTINATGYGLTLGLHSRLDSAARRVRERAHAGNIYINRSMIGAVVGAQPFGGEGLSGTGPKAGGPHYLLRFCTERTVSIDTTAAGGNADLLSMRD
ncbi:MAG: bifunctional proline dehydrogenase/L-glutamate gamma-semialdehyde dehydrogenase PutA [Steroidobacteraceae bacterium]